MSGAGAVSVVSVVGVESVTDRVSVNGFGQPGIPGEQTLQALADCKVIYLHPAMMATPQLMQAIITAHPEAMIYLPAGTYHWDFLASPNEVRIDNGCRVQALGEVTIYTNNPTVGVWLIAANDDADSPWSIDNGGSRGSFVSGVRTIGDYGVDIEGQERPSFDWAGGEADWIAWAAAWNTAFPTYTDLNSALSFKNAWTASVNVIDKWYDEPASTRNCGFYVVDSDSAGYDGYYAEDFNVGCRLRGSTDADVTVNTNDNYGYGSVYYCDQGILTRRGSRMRVRIYAENGSEIVHAEQHAFYNTDNPTNLGRSTFVELEVNGYNWQTGHVGKARRCEMLEPAVISARSCQGLVSIGDDVGGPFVLEINDQCVSPNVGTSGTKVAIDVGDSPRVTFPTPFVVRGRPSTVDAPQDSLIAFAAENCPGIMVPDGWIIERTNLIGEASASGQEIHFKLTDEFQLGGGYYKDNGNANQTIVTVTGDSGVGGCARGNILPFRSSGSLKLVSVSHQSADTVVTVNPSLVRLVNADTSVSGYNPNTSVQFVGTGTGNVIRMFAGAGDVVTHLTAAHPMTSTESGQSYDNNGASALVRVTLPDPVRGLTARIYCDNVNGIQLKAKGSATIRNAGSLSTAGGFITSTTVGSFVEVECFSGSSGTWSVTRIVGTWVLS